MATTIYSCLPASHDDPWALIEQHHAQWRCGSAFDTARSEYPVLPWMLEDLPGTFWRNVFTGHLVTVDHLESMPYGLKGSLGCLEPMVAGDTTLPHIERAAHIGLWTEARFCIDNWVRVDHLPPAVQLEWFGVEMRSCQRAITSLERQIAVDIRQHDNPNRNMHRRDLDSTRKRQDEALARAREFAAAQGLVVTARMVNEWCGYVARPAAAAAQPVAPVGTTQAALFPAHPEQLRLFA